MAMRPDILVAGALVLRNSKAAPERLDIVVSGGRIAALVPPGSAQSGDARVIDGRRRLAIPGLVNAHYHSHDVLCRGMFEDIPLEIWIALAILSPGRALSQREVRLRTLLGAVDCLRNGITTVQDMLGCGPGSEPQVEAAIEAYREAGIRCVLALQVGNRPAIDCLPGIRDGLPADLVPLLSAVAPGTSRILDFVEGALPAAGHLLSFGIAPGSPQRCTGDLMRGLVGLSKRHNLPFFTHVNESKLQIFLAQSLYSEHGGSVLDYLEMVGALDERLCMAHGIWFSDHEIERIARSGAAIVSCPTSNLKLKNGIAPLRKLKQVGVPLALGADNTSAGDSQNLFEAMKLVGLLNASKDAESSTWPAAEVLALATEGGARVLGLAGKIGSIAEGMAADLTLLDLGDPAYAPLNDVTRQIVYAESGRGVHTVIVNGAVVVDGGRVTTVDVTDLIDEARDLFAQFQRDARAHHDRLSPVAPFIAACVRAQAHKPLSYDRWLSNNDAVA